MIGFLLWMALKEAEDTQMEIDNMIAEHDRWVDNKIKDFNVWGRTPYPVHQHIKYGAMYSKTPRQTLEDNRSGGQLDIYQTNSKTFCEYCKCEDTFIKLDEKTKNRPY